MKSLTLLLLALTLAGCRATTAPDQALDLTLEPARHEPAATPTDAPEITVVRTWVEDGHFHLIARIGDMHGWKPNQLDPALLTNRLTDTWSVICLIGGPNHLWRPIGYDELGNIKVNGKLVTAEADLREVAIFKPYTEWDPQVAEWAVQTLAYRPEWVNEDGRNVSKYHLVVGETPLFADPPLAGRQVAEP